ncbi:GNAT family N-acetyltransferase [Aeromicrobium sp. CF3.5]|uniref:GNAT family N-acetyltransferase n=1 Tax=Aeromicrobium sp. CF3.5 TaxID=3373078 RepID=UPI003EE67EAE
MDLVLRTDDLTHPSVVALLEHHLTDFAQYSPAESMHALDLDGLRAADVTFWSAWDGEALVGCGALAQLDTRWGEIKSMRVADAFRGRGAGSAILQHLVGEARRRGYVRLSLETGSAKTLERGTDAFAPARALYARHGFVECGAFGAYTDDPWSTFMTLDLTASS